MSKVETRAFDSDYPLVPFVDGSRPREIEVPESVNVAHLKGAGLDASLVRVIVTLQPDSPRKMGSPDPSWQPRRRTARPLLHIWAQLLDADAWKTTASLTARHSTRNQSVMGLDQFWLKSENSRLLSPCSRFEARARR
jgi:hypothetical protein